MGSQLRFGTHISLSPAARSIAASRILCVVIGVVFPSACADSILRVVGPLTYRFSDKISTVGKGRILWTENSSDEPLACAIVAATGLSSRL
jgi:hypothetical protein